jgi:hypothetical protein
MTSQYQQLRTYCDDLAARVNLRNQWRLRHPDYDTQQFLSEMHLWSSGDYSQDSSGKWYGTKDVWYGYETPVEFKSSFDPNDLEPDTRDLLSVDTFLNLMTIALSAYEASKENA